MLLLLLSCTPSPEKEPADIPDLPRSLCGGEDYAWLDHSQTGQVLDVEAVPEWSLSRESIAGLAGLVGLQDSSRITSGATVYRVRYQTQDRGQPVEATMILALPDTPSAELPSLLYLHPTTGFEDFCAPSGRDITWAGIPVGLAGMGYAVAAPDYLGQNGFGEEAAVRHPYLVAEATAVASLDSLRALWSYAETDLGLTISRKTLLLGASQGGGGVLWSSRYAAEYLPEAELAGAVASVPALDLVAMAQQAKEQLSVASVGMPLTLLSMKDWYNLPVDAADILLPEVLPRLEQTMATDCPSAEIPEDITAVDQIYSAAWIDGFGAETLADWDPWGCMLAESSAGYRAEPANSTVPTLVILGGADEVSLVEAHRPAVGRLCAEGAQIRTVECAGLGHTDTVKATFDLQLSWLSDRLSKAALPTMCGAMEVQSCGE
jgi:pimeloyl-ACP methyl ester carboxylesterase